MVCEPGSGSLRLDAAVHAALGRPDCAARCLRRQDDSPLRWAAWLPLRPTATLPRPCPFFHLSCTHRNGSSVLDRVVANLRAFKKTLKKQVKARGRPDVLILGLDSTSLSNAQRFVPRLMAYLNETFGSIVFRHHSVTGHNTRENLSPFLSGRYYQEIQNAASADELTLIWRNFSSAGYATAFVEDMVKWPLFSLVGPGFTRRPTDAYWRPFLVAAARISGDNEVCVGDQQKLPLMLDFLDRFVKLYSKGPFFGLLWSADLTHSFSKSLALAEQPTIDFLEKHKKRLEQSFVIVMGDHGQRRDSLRETEVGRKEARLPLLTLSVPKRARDRLRPVLQKNAGRLTSHMDMFVTLADILGGGWAESGAQTGWRGVAPHGGHSLLRPLPPHRSCRDAGVPAEYCLCGQTEPPTSISNSSAVARAAARAFVGEINDRLTFLNREEEVVCAELTLASIRSARLMQSGVSGWRKAAVVLVVVEVGPSGGLFEGTLSVPASFDRPPTLLSPITRVNTYGSQPFCVETSELKPLCYCA